MAGTSENSIETNWTPSFSPWLIALAVMIPTFMEILDTTVANVALPHMAGTFSASTNEATWVLTSYLISNAIILPAAAWFSGFFGRKKVLLTCIGLFTLSSLMCGLSSSLGMLIASRVFQGIGGGALQPISQAILLESFPKEKRGMAMAAFGMGVILAPIIGPTLGGWITDNFSWQWVFYINLPIGILAFLMSQVFVEDPPYIKENKQSKIDFIGFGLMAVWLATLQIILDKGHEVEWFSAAWLRWFAVLSTLCFVLFIIREIKTKNPIVDLKAFANRNFALGASMMLFVGAVLYGTLAMLPLFLQNLMGYTAEQSGLTISPRGIGSFCIIIIVGRLISIIDNRILVALGFVMLGLSNFMLGNISFDIGMANITLPNILMGMGLGMIFIPLSTMAFQTLQNEKIGNATGIFNLMRNIGGSVGIAYVANLISNRAQAHQAYMVSHLTPYDEVFRQKIASLSHFFILNGSDAYTAMLKANGVIYYTLVKQASLFAFVDAFRTFALLALVLLPLVVLFERSNAKSKGIDANE